MLNMIVFVSLFWGLVWFHSLPALVCPWRFRESRVVVNGEGSREDYFFPSRPYLYVPLINSEI